MTHEFIARATAPIAPVRNPGFVERLAAMLAATDRFVTWWGAHRAWPANEAARMR